MMTNHSPSNVKPAQVSNYISEIFRPCTELGEWGGAESLPMYLQANWIYRRLDLAGIECLLMWDAYGEQQKTALNLRKHIEKLSAIAQMPIIYGVGDTTSFHRKRLIDQGIAFVVPGKQLYLPFVALNLRENFAASKSPARTIVSACAQQLVLLKCLGQWQSDLPAQTWAERLAVSKMSVSRAYKELSDLGIAQLNINGRQVNLNYETEGRDLWERALPHLSSPVKREIRMLGTTYHEYRSRFQWMHQEWLNRECAAGEWALSKLGMLASPKQACFALGKMEWDWFTKLNPARELDSYEESTVLIQSWRYEPNSIQKYRGDSNYVDPLSLFLSLQESKDDRTQMALHDLLEQTWEQVKDRS